jgi:hypothetical protein
VEGTVSYCHEDEGIRFCEALPPAVALSAVLWAGIILAAWAVLR